MRVGTWSPGKASLLLLLGRCGRRGGQRVGGARNHEPEIAVVFTDLPRASGQERRLAVVRQPELLPKPLSRAAHRREAPSALPRPRGRGTARHGRHAATHAPEHAYQQAQGAPQD